MYSPPLIKVAEVAVASLTEIYPFLSAFLSADFVKNEWKIPTPYFWSRTVVSSFGTIWNSVFLMMFFVIIVVWNKSYSQSASLALVWQ